MTFANQFKTVVSEFGEDPRSRQGRGIFADIWARVQGQRVHAYGIATPEASVTWHGLAEAPQTFAGLTGKLSNSGGVPYRNDAYPDVSTGLVEGPMGDPARRIFAQRAKRRSPMGAY